MLDDQDFHKENSFKLDGFYQDIPNIIENRVARDKQCNRIYLISRYFWQNLTKQNFHLYVMQDQLIS